MIYEAIYVCVFSVLEMLNIAGVYFILFGAQMSKKRYRIVYSIILAFVIQLLVLYYIDDTWMPTINMFYWLVIPLFWLEYKEKKWLGLYPIAYMGISLISVSASFVLAIILEESEHNIRQQHGFAILTELLPFFMMILYGIHERKNRKETIEFEMTWSQLVLYVITLFGSTITVGGIQLLTSGLEISVSLVNVFGLITALVCGGLVVISIYQCMMMYQETQYRKKEKQYDEFMRKQEEEIHRTVDLDKEMRQYRHDMRMNLTILQQYCQQENFEALKQQISKMTTDIQFSTSMVNTGCRAVDAVLHDLSKQAEKKKIIVKQEGTLPEYSFEKVYNLCMIISNLMKNAIEACEKIVDENLRRIEIYTSSFNDKITIIIKNTVAVEVDINCLYTDKADKQNHGFGLRIIRNIIAEQQGRCEFRCKDGWFEAEIVI